MSYEFLLVFTVATWQFYNPAFSRCMRTFTSTGRLLMGVILGVLYLPYSPFLDTSNMHWESKHCVSTAVLGSGSCWPVCGCGREDRVRALRSLQPQVEALRQRDAGAWHGCVRGDNVVERFHGAGLLQYSWTERWGKCFVSVSSWAWFSSPTL